MEKYGINPEEFENIFDQIDSNFIIYYKKFIFFKIKYFFIL